MKKLISILLCVCMVLTMGLAVAADGVSGDFTGTAQGLGGDVTVTLTLKDGKIVGCTATGDKVLTKAMLPTAKKLPVWLSTPAWKWT